MPELIPESEIIALVQGELIEMVEHLYFPAEHDNQGISKEIDQKWAGSSQAGLDRRLEPENTPRERHRLVPKSMSLVPG